jgi:ribosomal-protein-alanine N-acetyltransferase
LQLHRVEAACIPDNIRSIRVLEKAGFQREGLLRSYLRINGAWQDHYLYARISDDVPGSGRKD